MTQASDDRGRYYISYAHGNGFGSMDIIGRLPADFSEVMHLATLVTDRNGFPAGSVVVLGWFRYDKDADQV